MDNERKKEYAWVCLFFTVLIMFASLDWKIYKDYKAQQARKAIIEMAEKQPKP